MTIKLTRERLQEIAEDGFLKHGESKELASMALAAMESEPHTDDELSNLLWYSQEATCHSDPNYYCEFQRLATPGLIAGIIRELQERRKADSEPVAEITEDLGRLFVKIHYPTTLRAGDKLYRHAQHPVVPDDVLEALQKVARIRLDMNDFDGDLRGIADCLCDAEEALIEVVNRSAAMLQAQSDDDEPTDDERIMAIEGIIKPISDCDTPVYPDAEKRIADAVELLKKAAPAMLAGKSGPDGPLAGRMKSPAIPDGYVMVPKEPTEEMLQASYREASVYSPTAYRAMIAAAQQEVSDA